MQDDVRKIISRLLKEAAPGLEHERLKADLAEWARLKGYSNHFSKFQDGSIPDVLVGTPDDRYLFLGDAKDAENETVDRADTVTEVNGYIRNYAAHLSHYGGGYIAIATNSAAEAKRWQPVLDVLATAAGLTRGDGGKPSFQVQQFKANTWITWW